MAVIIPGIPQNLAAQQGNGQVLLTWTQVVGAVNYIVQRSTDNINYLNYASSGYITQPNAIVSYLDTNTALSTTYYYQVSALTSTGQSAYTNPVSVVPTLTGENSLSELRLRAKQRADMVNSQFVTDTEWNYYLNASAQELYDLLITTYEDYYVAPRLVLNYDSTNQNYPLPNGQNLNAAPSFYKLYGVDIGLDAGNQAFITLKKFSWIERNTYVFPQLQTSYLGVFNLRYRVIGNNLVLIPAPMNTLVVGIWYYPRLKVLLQDTDVLDGVSGWTEYVIVDAARKSLLKQESSVAADLMNEKLLLKSRIEEAASNRDAAQPERIASTRGLGTGYGGDWNNGWASPSAGF